MSDPVPISASGPGPAPGTFPPPSLPAELASPIPAPSLLLALSEGPRTLRDFHEFRSARPALLNAAPCEPRPTLVLPGLTAGDGSTAPLRSLLQHWGHPAHRWNLGPNLGPTPKVLYGLERRVRELAERHAQPLVLIGWSLGGIFARQAAHDLPDSVAQVITLGTPFRLDLPSRNRARILYDALGRVIHAPSHALPEFATEPPAQPTTSIYSRADGIVPWRTCLDPEGPLNENIEVVGSHCGLGHNPAALWVIHDRLARPAAEWVPFTPSSELAHLYPSL